MPPCDESAGNELGEVANVASQRQFDHRDDPTLDPRRIDLDLARRIPTDLEQPCHPASVFAAPIPLQRSAGLWAIAATFARSPSCGWLGFEPTHQNPRNSRRARLRGSPPRYPAQTSAGSIRRSCLTQLQRGRPGIREELYGDRPPPNVQRSAGRPALQWGRLVCREFPGRIRNWDRC